MEKFPNSKGKGKKKSNFCGFLVVSTVYSISIRRKRGKGTGKQGRDGM